MGLEKRVDATKDQVVGKGKEVAGDVANDDKLKAEGKSEGFLGKAKEAVEDVKDKIKDGVDDLKDKTK